MCIRASRAGLLTGLIWVGISVVAGPAIAGAALPAGGQFVAGSGTVQSAGAGMTVTQSSNHGIIDWNSFSIGSANAVQFNNGTGATLNRVTGGNLSQIDGSLSATGSVYLINPQGVVVGPGGKIVTNGSFVASTRDISNSAFMAGGSMTASGTSNGDVVNAGTITSKTGDAILVGRSVTNTGTISAPKGQGDLAAGNEIVLQTSGTGPHIAVSGGTGDVTNTGTVKAAQAALASAGGNVYALVENNGGIVSGTGTKTVDGHVWLTAGGTAQVTGTVTAKNADGSGGKVTVRGQEVSVSGSIDASATAPAKNGGDVSVIAKDRTVFNGTIKAKGGDGGKGGTVETSGQTLAVSGATVDTTAPNGTTGDWLLDPYNVTISSSATSNNALSTGTYTPSGDDSIINASDLETALGTSNVTVTTGGSGSAGSQTGDITVAAALGWSSSSTLTLNAYHSIFINKAITVSGAGGVVLKTNDGGTGGDYSFGLTSTGFAGSIDFTGGSSSGASLKINGTSYKLVYSMDQLDEIDATSAVDGSSVTPFGSGLAGNYALATSLDASGTSYTDALVGTDSTFTSATQFSGSFTGLGHTIANLSIDKPNTNNHGDYAGLFGYSTGTVRDIGIKGGSVAGNEDSGGLVGENDHGTISNAFATGVVSGVLNVGGLVGNFYGGTISTAYATGAVSSSKGNGTSSGVVGGLVGLTYTGTITDAYATGAVSGKGDYFGGLVGNNAGGRLTNVYATGAVNGTARQAGGTAKYVGGLVGQSFNGHITDAYATGAVSGDDSVGGLVGSKISGGTITNAYWDTQTSGITDTTQGVGNVSSASGVTGLTTAQLQGTDPISGSTYFSLATDLGDTGGTIWGGATNGLYPYLLSFNPTTPQAISGTAYSDSGVTPLASGASGAVTINLDAGGSLLGQATSGANGYYYVLVAGGTLTSSTAAVLASSDGANAGSRLDSGADVLDANNNVPGFDIWGSTLIAPTARTAYSDANTNLVSDDTGLINTADGNDSATTALVTGLASHGFIASGDFTIDQSLTLSNGLYVKTTGGDITVADALTLPDGNRLTLDSSGALAIDAPITAEGAAAVSLAYDTSDPANLSFGLTSLGFTGNIDYGSTNQGGTLTINGTSYTLLYSMADVDGIDGTAASGNAINSQSAGLSGDYALATSLDASGTTYTNALVGTSLTTKFTGHFTGLGHSISDLTIAKSGSYAGLFGNSRGTLRDIGILGGTVSGGDYVGGLAGYSYFGTIVDTYATNSVSGSNYVGGLVGVNNGSMHKIYATGTVSGNNYIGGLVGYTSANTVSDAFATGAVSGSSSVGGLAGANSGTLNNVYATGAVSGSADSAGGLVGYNYNGTITSAYATGAVSGNGHFGGLAGYNDNGTITNSTWDTQTSGTTTGIGFDNNSQAVTGLTTEDLQGALPTGFDSSVWGTGDGLYPYLLWQYPNGAQPISGIAYGDNGVTPLASGAGGAHTVSVLADGTSLGSVTTGANGYYYVVAPAGTLTGSTALLAMSDSGSAGARLATVDEALAGDPDGDGDNAEGFDIWASTLIAPTSDMTYSTASATTLQTQDASLIAQATGSDTAAQTLVAGLSRYGYIATDAGGFTVDQSLTLSNGLYVQTTVGDLTVANDLTLPGANGLTLAAAGALTINATVSVTGAGNVVTYAGYDDTGGPGDGMLLFSFGAGDHIDYGSTDNGGRFSSNGYDFTLLYNMGQVQAINGDGTNDSATDTALSGFYALATPLDAATDPTTPANWTPIGTDGLGNLFNHNDGFNGGFEGLGNTISNLTVDIGSNELAGLFGYADGGIRDLGLIGGSVSGGGLVGALVGQNYDTIANDYSTATVKGSGDSVGGLVGAGDYGIIIGSYATGSVSGGGEYVGGLVGDNYHNTLFNDYATGAVSAGNGSNDIGGLAGTNESGLISNSYATGSVTNTNLDPSFYPNVGGLAGYSDGEIDQSYATGAVIGGEGASTGGLVGWNNGGLIRQSYATGAVAGGDGGSWVGGLVGWNDGDIDQSYAMGAVRAGLNGSSFKASVGGLVGDNNPGATITQSYSTGAVSSTDPAAAVGGFIGNNDSTTPSDVDVNYFDTLTSGTTLGIGAGNGASGVTGQTTAQLQGTLPSGFDNTVWGTGTGLYPYFLWQYSSTPLAVTGFAYSDAGTTPLASGASGAVTVSALVDGTGIGSATTGANGYYYVLAPSGTLAGTQQLLSYVNGNAVDANTFVADASGNTTADLWGGWLRLYSDASTTSAMFSGLSTALGSNSGSDFLYGGSGLVSGTSLGIVSANAGGFAIDTALDVGSNSISLDAAGAVTQSAALTAGSLHLLGSSANFTLDNSSNAVDTLAADTGAVTLADSADLAVDTVDGTAGVTSSGAATLTTTGNLTIGSGAHVTAGSGSDVALAATGNFINDEGGDAVVVSGGGRWIIYSAAPGSDTFGSLDSGNTAVWDASYATLAPGSVSQSGNRYLFAYQPTLTVTTTDASKTYGDDASATVASAYSLSGYEAGVSGAFLGDTAANVYSGTPSVTSTGSAATASVAGGPYAITASTGTLTMLNGYALAFTNTGTLTVGKAALTVTANDDGKTYDGLSYSGGNGVSYSGFVDGEDSSVLSGTLAYGGTAQGATDAGSYTITASGLSSGNYDISYDSGTLTVGKASLTVTANDDAKTYDGLSYSGGNGVSYSGFVNGEDNSVLSGTLAYGGTAQGATDAGSYTITPSGLTSGNYAVTFANGTLTVDRASLTVTANDDAKTYDGLSYSGGNGVSYSGFVNGEDNSVLSGTLAYGGTAQGATDAGSYTITASGLTSGNYAVTFANGTLTVDRASLTVTANDDAKTYDGLSYSGGNGVSYSGFVNGQDSSVLSGTLAYGGTAQGATDAGSYTITASGLSSGNYDISYDSGTLTVGKASLTVTANDDAKTYDGLSYSGGNGVSYSGFVDGEDNSVLSGTLAYGGTAQGATDAGSYTITPSGLTSGNYAVTFDSGTLTVDRASLTVTANDDAKTYDGLSYSGGNGVSYSGFVDGEDSSVLGGTLSYGGTAQGATDAGSYTITPSGLTSGNYAVTFANGTLTVDRASLTVTANDDAKTYDGLSYSGGNGVSYSGFVNGEDNSVLSGTLAYGGTAQGATDAGTYTITASGLSSGNYAVTFANGTLTVGKASLTVTANDDAKTYDGLSYSGGNGVSYSGFVNGEDSSVLSGTVAYGGTAQGATDAGSYTITPSGLTSGNYAVTFANGTLTVDRASLTVTANDDAKTYDGLSYSGGNGVSYSGFVNGEDNSVLSGTVAYGGTAQGATDAGTYTITASGLSSGNYAVTFANGTLTVDRASLTVTANDDAKTYDGLSYSGGNGVSYSGFVNGEDNSVLSGTLAYGGTAQGATDAGSYTITPSGLTSGNYAVTFANGTLTVNLAPLAITANDVTAASLATAQFTASYLGFVNGETSALVSGLQYGLFPVAGSSLQYDIVPFGASAPNYAISYFEGLLTVAEPDAPIINNEGLSSFTLTSTFGTFSFSNVVTAALGNGDIVLLFQVGLPGDITPFDAIALGDYSNATNSNDRLVLNQ